MEEVCIILLIIPYKKNKGGFVMLGIPDVSILLVYILCILSAALCLVYGIINWNKGAEIEKDQIEEVIKWEKDEVLIDEKL
jgi:hypothetical protein